MEEQSFDDSGFRMPPDMSKEFAEFMVVDDENIPDDVRSSLWGFICKDNILSRSNDKDRKRFENRMCIARNLKMMMMPSHEITMKELLDFANTQNRNTIQVNGSIGGFERQALTTQIKELRQARLPSMPQSGMLDSLKRRLGFNDKQPTQNPDAL